MSPASSSSSPPPWAPGPPPALAPLGGGAGGAGSGSGGGGAPAPAQARPFDTALAASAATATALGRIQANPEARRHLQRGGPAGDHEASARSSPKWDIGWNQGFTDDPPAPACEAAGLQIAVRAWWRGTPGRAGSTFAGKRQLEDRWLRDVTSGGLAGGARQRLLSSGIPERVVDAGIQLSHFCFHDKDVRLMWARCQREKQTVPEFVKRAMECVLSRFRVRAAPPKAQLLEDSDLDTPSPSLVLTPLGAPSASEPRPPPNAGSSPLQKHGLHRRPSPLSSLAAPASARGSKLGRRSDAEWNRSVVIGSEYQLSPSAWQEVPVVDFRSPRGGRASMSGRLSTTLPELHGALPGGAGGAADSASEDVPNIGFALRATASAGRSSAGSRTARLSRFSTNESQRSSSSTATAATSAATAAAAAAAAAAALASGRRSAPPGAGPSPRGFRASLPVHRVASLGGGGGDRGDRGLDEEEEEDCEAGLAKRSNQSGGAARIGRARFCSSPAAGESSLVPSRRGSVIGWDPLDGSLSSRRGRRVTQSNFESWLKGREVTDATKRGDAVHVVAKEEKASEDGESFSSLRLKFHKGNSKVIRDIEEVRRIFNHYDKDSTGTIENSQFLNLLSRLLRQPIMSMDVAEIWRSWEGGDGDSTTIRIDEFIDWYCRTFDVNLPDFTSFISTDIIPESEKMIREVAKKLGEDNVQIEKIYKEFAKLDDDGSGLLEYPEFEQLMTQALSPRSDDPQVPTKVLQKFWIDIDADGSGGVTFEEFAGWYLRFFHGTISPMEQYYHMLGVGYRKGSVQTASPHVRSALQCEHGLREESQMRSATAPGSSSMSSHR